MQVHARAIDPGDGFRHERGINILQLGQFLDDEFGGHQVIGHGQGIGVLEVNLVLAGRAFVMGVFDRYTHVGQIEHGVAAQVGGREAGKLIEVTVEIQQFGGSGVLKIKELELGAHVVGESQLRCPLEVPLEHVAGISGEGLAALVSDVADHAGHGVLPGSPRQQGKGGEIGIGAHIAFVMPGETIDGRTVEADALVDGILQVIHVDGEALQFAQNVGKPQADEFHVVFPGCTQYIISVEITFSGHRNLFA